jgi:hypothetical protein
MRADSGKTGFQVGNRKSEFGKSDAFSIGFDILVSISPPLEKDGLR